MKVISKDRIVEYLSNLGIDYFEIVNFLKKDCKIERGFEAQRVGMRIESATTTGLITYILATLGELTEKEESQLKSEILSFKIDEDKWSDSTFGSQLYASVWATSQCLLGLLSLRNISKQDVYSSIKWLCRMQSRTGGWSFSGKEEERIIYMPYSILTLIKYNKRFGDMKVLSHLRRAYEWSRSFRPTNNIDKIIRKWLLLKLLEFLKSKYIKIRKSQINIHSKINFSEVIEQEFRSYIVFEHSIYPFSMQLYTPALYLFTRKFSKPDNPFNLYLIKYLLNNQIDGRSWSHITSPDQSIPYSFCTALSLFTLYYWAYDSIKEGIEIRKLPSFEMLKQKIKSISYIPPKIFISYSRPDKKLAKKIAKSLVERGYPVWFDEWEIKVGDSIIDKINKGIIESDFLLLLLSKKSVKSKWVKEELNAAKMREIEKRKVFILPILLEDCKIPPLISGKKYADFRESYRKGLKEILDVLESGGNE